MCLSLSIGSPTRGGGRIWQVFLIFQARPHRKAKHYGILKHSSISKHSRKWQV